MSPGERLTGIRYVTDIDVSLFVGIVGDVCNHTEPAETSSQCELEITAWLGGREGAIWQV